MAVVGCATVLRREGRHRESLIVEGCNLHTVTPWGLSVAYF